jgi:putative SOS response-associated peptidase YedK
LKNLQNNNKKGRTLSSLLTEGLLEKLILAKTKHNNGTVVQGAFKRENPQKWTKSIRSSTISTNVRTEKLSHSRFGTDIFQGKRCVLIAD